MSGRCSCVRELASGVTASPITVTWALAVIVVRVRPTPLHAPSRFPPPTAFFTSFHSCPYDLRLLRGILADQGPLLDARMPDIIGCVRARNGTLCSRAVRMSDESFKTVFIDLPPRVPQHGPKAAFLFAMTLQYLGEGSVINAWAVLSAPRTAFYIDVSHVVDAIHYMSALEFRMPLGDGAWRAAIAGRFQLRGDRTYDYILRALDGIAVKQEHLADGGVPCVADYFCRKKIYALDVQAICDAEYRFS